MNLKWEVLIYRFLMELKKGERLNRKERIRKREDFSRLGDSKKRYHSNQYLLIVVKNNLNYSRIAVSIRKKVGNAVIRNYEKRLCREVFRKEKKNLKKGFDILIVIKKRTKIFYNSYNSLKYLLISYLG